MLIPDHIYLSVACYRLESDMRNSLIDEAQSDIMIHREFQGTFARDLCLSLLSFIAIRKLIVRKSCTHDSSTCQGKRDARGIYCNPSSPPQLRNICSGTTSAGWIENQISWIRGHEHATLNQLNRCLNDIHFRIKAALDGTTDISPRVSKTKQWKVIQKPNVGKSVAHGSQSPTCIQPLESHSIGFP